MAMDIAIDLGTSRIRIYTSSKGIIIDQPCMITIDLDTGNAIAFGDDAYKMMGKTSDRFNVISPLNGGVITDFDAIQKVITHFLQKVGDRGKIVMPRAVACIPTEVTEVEKRAVVDAISSTGVRKVFLIEESLAAAIGSGIDTENPHGFLIVDIGGGTTDMAVVSLNGIATSKTIKLAGNDFDEEIIKYAKTKYNLLIGKATAERAKIEIGCVCERPELLIFRLKGRDYLTGMPTWVDITSDEIMDILVIPTMKIISQIKEMLEITDPELIGDIFSDGVHLSGGCCQIYGMDKLISEKTNLDVHIAENPSHSVIRGAGKSINFVKELDNQSFGKFNPLVDGY